jgi:signal transduction histidine kinase
MDTNPRAFGGKRGEGFGLTGFLSHELAPVAILVDTKARTARFLVGAEVFRGNAPDSGTESTNFSVPLPLRQIAEEVACSGKGLAGETVKISTATGAVRAWRVTAVPLGESGAGFNVALMMQDLTGIQRFDEQVLQLDRLANLGTLAAGTAHEVKNALVPCRTFVDLLLEQHPSHELAQVVRREMGRIDALLTRMLKFARPSEAQLVPIHLHEVLEHSLRLVERQIEQKRILCDHRPEAASDLVQGNEHELQQAFVNLLLNAVEAMELDGKLKIRTALLRAEAEPGSSSPGTAAPSQLQITVEDTGAGIPPEVLHQVFEPFVTTKPSGTGLGLAITRQIVQHHGGSISVQSQPGQGTVFTIRLGALEQR